jgi:hypothetical protein
MEIGVVGNFDAGGRRMGGPASGDGGMLGAICGFFSPSGELLLRSTLGTSFVAPGARNRKLGGASGDCPKMPLDVPTTTPTISIERVLLIFITTSVSGLTAYEILA